MTSWLIKQFEHNATRPVSEWLTKQGNDRTWVLVLDEDTQCAEASLLHSFFSPSGSFWPADGRIRKTKKLISPFCSPLPPPTLVSWPALSSQPHSLAKTSIYVKQLFSPPQPSNFQRHQLLYVSKHGFQSWITMVIFIIGMESLYENKVYHLYTISPIYCKAWAWLPNEPLYCSMVIFLSHSFTKKYELAFVFRHYQKLMSNWSPSRFFFFI